ncbi:MAG: orotidine-5'-phosphate decarboxylase [candidate division Zixibacteria bacterium]|nr:orotidine-5'-phosphate decarboxylase [candidate division Zixibacteria bacterium]
MDFITKLRNAIRINNSHVCVGLDTEFEKLPARVQSFPLAQGLYNREIIESTKEHACAYKLNIAFYECRGVEGWQSLEETIKAMPDDIPIIIDAKRADIGNTSRMYAQAIYDRLGADAVTVNPYLGIDGIKPFLEYKDKCAFILCHTSNASSADFQRRVISDEESRPMLFEIVARKAKEWNDIGACGLVVGANVPDDFARIIKLAPGLPMLIPGIGAQGGDIRSVVESVKDTDFLINSSRGIIFPAGYDNFAEGAQRQASALKDIINDILYRRA